MFVSDHPSRAFLSETDPNYEDVQISVLELETVDHLRTVKISSESLRQLQKTTEEDLVMQALKTTIMMGWPHLVHLVAVCFGFLFPGKLL